MFGTNEITGRKFFQNEDRLFVTSTFYSLQGEGPYQGQPAVFVRLAKCNLQCSFCDAFFDEGTWFTNHELIQRILGQAPLSAGVVFTGGEPLLQNIFPALLSCEALGFKFTQIESNGLLYPSLLPQNTTLVVSPKCHETTGKYLTPHALSLNRANCLKFIVSSDSDSPYHTIPEWAFDWQRATKRPIYISPMNMYTTEFLEKVQQRIAERKQHSIEHRSTADEVVSWWDDGVLDREKNRANHSYAAKFALQNGFYLTLQMQLFASIA